MDGIGLPRTPMSTQLEAMLCTEELIYSVARETGPKSDLTNGCLLPAKFIDIDELICPVQIGLIPAPSIRRPSEAGEDFSNSSYCETTKEDLF